MRRDTSRALHELNAEPTPLADRIAAARARARPAPQVLEPTLPTGPLVPTVTLTTDQLHDLVYAAGSQYLQSLSGMTKDRARQHADRIAAQADLVLHAEHDVTMGRSS